MTRRVVWSSAAEALFSMGAPTAVSAGAGSGKTTCLVELCVRLLSGEATGTPCDPSEIAAITFTEKAATELDDRLRQALVARAAASPPGSAEARAWRLRLHGLQRMAIGTIHGFARRLLREHAAAAGLDPDLDVLDEETARGWRREAARAAVLAALDAGRPEAQLLAAAHGAGGRRAGLADVVADIGRERATLGDVAPIRPAADAGDEAQEARQEALAAAEAVLAARREVRTATGLRAMAALAGAWGRLAPDDRAGPLRVEALARVGELGRAVRGWRVGSGDGERARALRDDLLRAVERFAPRAAEVLAAAQKRELCALVTEAEARYRARKQVAGAADFDDLLVSARALLRDRPDVRGALRRRLRALLVDEYQDVNAVQQEVFELLTDPCPGSPAPVLVAVGDLKQSIYRFRGADVAVFRGVLERFGAGGGRVLHLTANHRSVPAVLDLVNEVSSRCMQPGPAPSRPYELAFAPDDRLTPVRPPGPAQACEILEDAEGGAAAGRRLREARGLAARITALVSGTAGVEVRERGEADAERPRRPRYGDVAMLFRRLTQIAPYERALREAGIPYRLARGGGFYQAPEVRDLGELLASLADPEDAIAWAALLRSPWCGVADGTLFALSRIGLRTLWRRDPREVVRALAELHPTAAGAAAFQRDAPGSTEAERLRVFLGEWQALHAVRDRLALPDLLRRAIEAVDLEAALLAGPGGERSVLNVRKVLALAEGFARGGGTAAGFAERLRAMADQPPREPEAELEAGDAVALLSIHQAKGLEWPVVLVPDLGAAPPRDGRRALRAPSGALAAAFHDPASDVHHETAALVSAREEARRAGAAESRRLLYVALTRAKDYLILSGEAGRGGETWRALIEAGVALRPELVRRLPLGGAAPRADAEPAQAVGAAAARDAGPRRDPGAVSPPGAEPALPALAPALPPPAVRMAVTELAEHARCPRRLHLARDLRLAERGAGGGASHDDPDRATARGTLAHAMLAEVDLAAPPLERRLQLAAAATRRGYDPQSPGIRRILLDVARFLDLPPGQELARAARAGALRREVPFLLRVEEPGGAPCYLVGAVDALVEGRKEIALLDFKYALGRPGSAGRYRWQLLAYAAAAARAFPGRAVTARLQFLRGACASVDVTPTAAELRGFALDATRLARAAHAGRGLALTPAELGRTPERCAAEGCGFVQRCHPHAALDRTERARRAAASTAS